MKRIRLFLAGCVFTILCASAVKVGFAVNVPDNIWSQLPQLTFLEAIPDPTSVIDPVRYCSDYTVTTRPFMVLPSFPFIQTEQEYTSCFANTANGLLDGKYFLAKNTGIAGKITSDQSTGVMGVPGSNIIFHTQPLPYPAFYLKAYLNPLNKLTAQISSTKEVSYKLNGLADVAIADKAGNKLPIIPSSMAFSKNGKWLTADLPGTGSIRVDLTTFDVLPFGYKSTYFEGNDPAIRTAISNDGRYAAIYSPRNSSYFSVFDLSSCSAVPDKIIAPVTCAETELASFVRSQAEADSTYMSVKAVSFVDTDTLQLYLGYRPSGGSIELGKYLLKAGSGLAFNSKYLALGDSFSSGEGAHNYEAYTDIPENRCHLSKQSYPYLLALSAGFNDFHSVACSGSVIEDVLGRSSLYNQNQKQGKGKAGDEFDTEILTNFLPGYRAQILHLEKNKPEAITLTMGGNDIGFGDIIKLCVMPETCYATRESRLEKVQEINRQFDQLVDLYTTLQNASPKTRIYVIGYPKITSLNEKCGINVRLNANELDFADQLVSYMNSVIKQATLKAGVLYTDIEESLTNTTLCSGADDENISVNGLTAGNDQLPGIGPIGNESYHPNQNGHVLMSQAIATKTSNLTRPMPSPVSSAAPPDTEGLPFVESAPVGDRVPRYLVNDPDMTLFDQIIRGEDMGFDLQSNKYLLQPLSNAEVVVYSEPTFLGNLQLNSNGEASGTFNIPDSLNPGFHTLHIFATNIAGEEIDIYKGIYIGATQNDFDGDGVKDEYDDCWLMQDLGVDYDQDNLDDGCDPEITEPPIVPITLPSPVAEEPFDPKNQPPTYSDPLGSASHEPQNNDTPPRLTTNNSPSQTSNGLDSSLDPSVNFVSTDANNSNKVLGESKDNINSKSLVEPPIYRATDRINKVFIYIAGVILLAIPFGIYVFIKHRQNLKRSRLPF